MYLFPVLALLLFVVFLIFVGRQSASVQRNRKSQRNIWPDANSDLSLLSPAPPQDMPDTLPGSVHEATYHNAPVGNYATDSVVDGSVSVGCVDYGSSGDSTGGELGGALADAIDAGGSSFDAFDSGSDFGGSSTSDGSSS
jgi:hypothetical protein